MVSTIVRTPNLYIAIGRGIPMRDKGIIAGAAVCAVVGLVALCVVAQGMQPVKTEILYVEPGDYVACEGIVYSVRYSGNHCFVNIYDGSTIVVPLFNYTGKITVGDLLYVEGMVSVYHGEREIIPEQYKAITILYGMCTHSELHTVKGVFCTDLEDGFHAVAGSIANDHVTVEREIGIPLLEFHGKITDKDQNTFQLFGSSYTFITVNPVDFGEVSGIGICIDQKVVVLYCQWDEYPFNTIAEAKQCPEGYPVKISGHITSITIKNGHIFLVVTDSTGCIIVPVFKDNQDSLGVDVHTFSQGQTITVVGTIHNYQGTPEILPEVIT